MSLTYEEVREAYGRIKDYIVKTPLQESFYLGDGKRRYYFKLESLQHAKSFKIRGALNKLLSLTEEERKCGIAAVSSGNHGSSVSYAASLLGIGNAKVIVPRSTPRSKVERIEFFGAEVLFMGNDYDEAHELGMAYIRENGLTNIDAYYDDPLVYQGQGTIAIELFEQNRDIDTIVVPIGGGGLITGIAVAAKAINPNVSIIGVQTEACPAMVKSYEDRVFYEEYPIEDSLCDALVGGIGKLSYEMAESLVDDFIVVSEESIGRAVSFMARQEKFIVEAASCTAVAAVMDHGEEIGGQNIALIMTGSNIDGDVLAALLNRY